MAKEVMYMVHYVDDNKVKHITFVKNFSAIKFFEDRFGSVSFESASKFINYTEEEDDEKYCYY